MAVPKPPLPEVEEADTNAPETGIGVCAKAMRLVDALAIEAIRIDKTSRYDGKCRLRNENCFV